MLGYRLVRTNEFIGAVLSALHALRSIKSGADSVFISVEPGVHVWDESLEVSLMRLENLARDLGAEL